MVLYGLVGVILISFEIMLTKWLCKQGVNGDFSGIIFLFVEGIIGTSCLIVTTLAGTGLHLMTYSGFGLIMIAGLSAFTALVILNYTCAVGSAGI